MNFQIHCEALAYEEHEIRRYTFYIWWSFAVGKGNHGLEMHLLWVEVSVDWKCTSSWESSGLEKEQYCIVWVENRPVIDAGIWSFARWSNYTYSHTFCICQVVWNSKVQESSAPYVPVTRIFIQVKWRLGISPFSSSFCSVGSCNGGLKVNPQGNIEITWVIWKGSYP
jgi:hypothetical protein